MSEISHPIDFDIQTAWLRRFEADAGGNLQAFALRLKEAMPEHVTLHESVPFFFGKSKITGVSIAIGEHKYTLEIINGHLKANVALIVREIALNTKSIEPTAWFAQLASETKETTEHAKSLSQSISAFMSS